MRNALFVLAIAGLSACANTSPTDVSPERRGPAVDMLPNYLYVSMPDSLVANETGKCDYPISWTSTFSAAVSFHDSQITLGTGSSAVTYDLSAEYMADVSGGPIPANSSSGGMIYDEDLSPPHTGGMYQGTVFVTWLTPGGTWQYTFLGFTCWPRRIGT